MAVVDDGSVRRPDTAIFQIPPFSMCESPENQTDGVRSDDCTFFCLELTQKITGQNYRKLQGNYTKSKTEDDGPNKYIEICVWVLGWFLLCTHYYLRYYLLNPLGRIRR